MSSRELLPGIVAVERFRVTEAETAAALGSGDVPVLGTPGLLAWMEAASVAAIAAYLEPAQTSVGWKASIEHLRPSFVGSIVAVEAAVETVDRSRIGFSCVATEADVVVGRAQIIRAIVDRERFQR